jgi:hypothetical protein
MASGFFSDQVVGALRAPGQILQWQVRSVNPSGWRHHESGVLKPDAKLVPFCGGFTAQKESGVPVDFGQILFDASGFATPTIPITFNLGEVNSHPDSYFNLMVADGSVSSDFKAFNMRFWVGNLDAFAGLPQPTFYFQNSAEWRRRFRLEPFVSGIEALGLAAGVSVVPSSMPLSGPNVFAKSPDSPFISGSFQEKEMSHFLYVKGVFPSGNYPLGTYGGLGQGDFTLKFSYDYTSLDANIINPQDLADFALFTPNPTPQIADMNVGVSGHWRLNEVSGDRFSEVSGFPGEDMTAVASNNPTSCSGIIASGIFPSGIALQGDGTGGTLRHVEVSQSTETVDFSFLGTTGPTSFVFTGWVNFDNMTEPIQGILGRWGDVGATPFQQYKLFFSTNNRKFTFAVEAPNGQAMFHRYVIMDEEVVPNKWYFFVAGYDAINNETVLRINDRPIDRRPLPDQTPGLSNDDFGFLIGASERGSVTDEFIEGCIDSVTLYRGLVPRNEILLQIYNNGQGVDYPFPTDINLDFTQPPPTTKPSDPGLRKSATFVTDFNFPSGVDFIRDNTAAPGGVGTSGTRTFPTAAIGEIPATSGIIFNTRPSTFDVDPSGALSFSREIGASGYYNYGNVLPTRLLIEHNWTIGLWVKLTDNTEGSTFVSKWAESSDDRRYMIQYSEALDTFRFRISTDGTAGTVTNITPGGFTPILNRWYCIIVEFDTVNNRAELKVYDAVTGQSFTGAATVSAEFSSISDDASFQIGAATDFSTAGQYCDADIDNLWMWHRVLTNQEKTQFFNNGNGNEWDVFKQRDA